MTVFPPVSNLVAGVSARKPPAVSYKTPDVDWGRLVRRVQAADADGLDELYSLFGRGIRLQLCRQLGPHELDDRVHDTFLLVLHAVQKGDLRDPERLMAFVRTIVRRQVAVYISDLVEKRKEQVAPESGAELSDCSKNPEQSVISNEARHLIDEVLARLTDRDREILTRFYLHEQTAEEVCAQMDLNENQFRLLKSRAKARFGMIGKKNLHQRALGALFVRTSAATSH